MTLGLLALAIACGPVVDEPTATGAGSTGGSGESTDPDSSESSETRTSGSSSDSGSESSGNPIACEAFHDEAAEGTPVEIEIRNVGTETVLLDAPCFNHDYLGLGTPSGWRWPGGFCSGTCQSVFVDGCFVCDGCASASYTVVMPGASVTVTWDGILFADVAPPEECFEFGSCGDTCPRARLPTAEIVTATVRAITHADCVAMEVDPTVCDCADPLLETCENYGSTYIEPTIMGTATYEPGAPGPIVVELAG